MVSIINDTHRLEINQATKIAVLWNVDSRGMEESVVQEERQRISTDLFQNIQNLRGHIDVVEEIAGPQIPSQEVFQQLKLLGYINERESCSCIARVCSSPRMSVKSEGIGAKIFCGICDAGW